MVYVAFLVLARHSSKTIVPHFLISYLLLLLLIGLINLHFSLENTNIITLITEVRLEKKLLALLARIKFPVSQFILLRTLRILLYETILANIALIQHILLFAYFVRTSIYESSFQVTIWKINNILTRLAYYVLEGILARTSYKLTLLHALLKVKWIKTMWTRYLAKNCLAFLFFAPNLITKFVVFEKNIYRFAIPVRTHY